MSGTGSSRLDVGNRFGRAWLVLTAVLALHVADEALNDFLHFYNPYVEAWKEAWPWLPFPTFAFPTWISLLVIAVLSLGLMSLCAYRTFFWTPFAAKVYSAVMFANGALHLVAAWWTLRAIPGVYTAPLCILAAVHLWRQAGAVRDMKRLRSGH